LQWQVRWLRPEAVLARRLRLPPLARLAGLGAVWNGLWEARLPPADARVQVRPVREAGPEFDALWQACAAQARASLVRDSAWVQWRYLSAPALDYVVLLAEREGTPAGYLAYRIESAAGRRVGYIADVAALPDGAALAALLRRALADMRAGGAETAAGLFVPGTAAHQALRRAGFVFSWGAYTVGLVPLAGDLPMDVLRDPRAWALAGGDFDVF
jgi:hypothetical protein